MKQDIKQHGEQEAEEGSPAVPDPACLAAAQEAVRRVLSAADPVDARAVLQSVSKILQVQPTAACNGPRTNVALSSECSTDKTHLDKDYCGA